MKIHLKKREHLFWINNFTFIWWATLLNNRSYEPHGTYVSGFTFLLHQEGPKNHNHFFTFVRGWNSLPGPCSDLDVPTHTRQWPFIYEWFCIAVVHWWHCSDGLAILLLFNSGNNYITRSADCHRNTLLSSTMIIAGRRAPFGQSTWLDFCLFILIAT